MNDTDFPEYGRQCELLTPWHNRRTERLPLHHRGKQWREN